MSLCLGVHAPLRPLQLLPSWTGLAMGGRPATRSSSGGGSSGSGSGSSASSGGGGGGGGSSSGSGSSGGGSGGSELPAVNRRLVRHSATHRL